MLSWQVGRVKITRIVEMDLPVPAKCLAPTTPSALRKMPWLYPHFVSEDDSTLFLSVHALLVEAPGLRLVVDTCVGNDRPREITGDQPLSTPFLQHPIAHHPCQIAHPDWVLGDNGAQAAIHTRASLFGGWADQPILVIGTHFASPTGGHIVREGDGL